MKIHTFEHVAFETSGMIGEWARARGYTLSTTRWYADETMEDLADIDWLVIMGGPMSVTDEDIYPWLRAEKRCIAQAIASHQRVLGICLGAQLIAETLGARVYSHTQKEIGWFPIELTDAGRASPIFENVPSRCAVLHWHGDTFDMPVGATHLARSAVCAHQAFQYGERVIGFQFHMEMTNEGIERILAECAHELIEGDSIQGANEICAGETVYLADAHKHMTSVLNALVAA